MDKLNSNLNIALFGEINFSHIDVSIGGGPIVDFSTGIYYHY